MAWEFKNELIMDGPTVVGSIVNCSTHVRVEIGHHVFDALTQVDAEAFARGVESAQAQVKAVMAQLHMVLIAAGGKVTVPRTVVADFDARKALIWTGHDLESGGYTYEAGHV